MKNVIVSGSRTFDGNEACRNTINRVFNQAHANDPIAAIWHGAAKGLDTMVSDWITATNQEITDPMQRIDNVKYRVTPEDWNTYGRGAGHRRNAIMLKEAITASDSALIPLVAVAFYLDRPTNGTAGMVDKMLASGIKTLVVTMDSYGKVLETIVHQPRKSNIIQDILF